MSVEQAAQRYKVDIPTLLQELNRVADINQKYQKYTHRNNVKQTDSKESGADE